MRAMLFLKSALTLLVTRVGADHTNHTLAAHDLAIAAHLLDGSGDFHGLLRLTLLGAEDNPRTTQIVGREFHSHFIARQNADVVHAHLAGNVTEYHMPIFQFDPEGGIGEILKNLSLHLDGIVFGHISSS
jgi:hypothetical protein